ncbi:MAG: hypothetical protein HYX74_04300 [Acidobacteria bacterium]|nr:hypothetical protein [Acidobacteriota bacterium]
MSTRKIQCALVGAFLFLSGWLVGQREGKTEKTVIHAVAWTILDTATEQDFEHLKKATGDLVGVLPGLRRAWIGKLRAPLAQGDQTRTYGLVFEFDDVKSRQSALGNNTPAEWAKLRDKVRLAGQANHTTFDVVGE